jgi:hypothetical protein
MSILIDLVEETDGSVVSVQDDAYHKRHTATWPDGVEVTWIGWCGRQPCYRNNEQEIRKAIAAHQPSAGG